MWNQSLQLVFPRSLVDLEEVSSLMQIKEKLEIELRCSGSYMSSLRYRFVLQRGRYGYAKCSWKGCLAGLRYLVNEQGRLRLTKALCHHQHMLHRCKNFKFRAVSDYLSSLPVAVPPSSLKRVLCPQFGISQKQLYYIMSRVRGKAISTSELVQNLEEEGYDVFLSQEQPKGRPPELLIVVNQQMRRYFRKFGDVVSFDLTFNLVKNSHPSGKTWKIGCFIAITSARRIAPLAIVATLYQTQETYMRILQTFFRAMDGQPAVLVTDQETAIHAAVEELQKEGIYNGIHLYDGYHILHNVRKRLKVKENIILFSRILHARNNAEFEMLLKQAYARIEPEERLILQRFKQRSHLYCFSQIQPRFLGFSSSSSPNQCLHSLLKRAQPSQKQYSIAVRNTIQYTKQLLQKCQRADIETAPLEDIFLIPEIKAVRMMLSKPVMSHLVQELAHSIKLEAVEGPPNRLFIKEHGHHFQLELRSQQWICNCEYYEKVNLPCRHQLRALLVSRHSILHYLPQRWHIQQEMILNPRQRGREKKSSRNMIR